MEDDFLNIDREEDICINKNDISPNKKSTIGFKPLEQITDKDTKEPFDRQDNIEDEIEKNEEEMFKDFVDEINYDKNSEAKRIEQLNTDIRMSQSENVTSVGPDVDGESIGNEFEKEFKNVDLGNVLINTGLESMNPQKTINNIYEIKKYNKESKDIGKRNENLKTLPEKKKERSLRGIIRNILGMQQDGMTVKQRREAAFLESNHEEMN